MSLPVHGLMIAATTAATLLLSAVLVSRLVGWLQAWREALRARYGHPRWRPAGLDLLGLPLWWLIELLCLALALVFTLVGLFVAYQAARGLRDWWHAGARRTDR